MQVRYPCIPAVASGLWRSYLGLEIGAFDLRGLYYDTLQG